jgi:hypothetical protein
METEAERKMDKQDALDIQKCELALRQKELDLKRLEVNAQMKKDEMDFKVKLQELENAKKKIQYDYDLAVIRALIECSED